MNNPVRVLLFIHYWWMILLLLVMVITITLAVQPDNKVGTIVAACAGAVSVIYFVQKQKLEELELFEKLFTRFNEQYGRMNERLQAVANGTQKDEVHIRSVLDSYFNLCAEEYLFYQQGLILRSVWQAWCLGMVAYLDSPHSNAFVTYLEGEQARFESYYGLTSEVIREGSRLVVAPPVGQTIRLWWTGNY
jgi:hypothetical protein